MKYRFPDDPFQVPPHELFRMLREEAGRRVGQFKWDGWRKPAYHFEDGWKMYAKRDEQKQSPPDALCKEFYGLRLPVGTALDMEWMGPRSSACRRAGMVDRFMIFDLLYWNGEWMGDVPFIERYARLRDMIGEGSEHISLSTLYDGGDGDLLELLELFERSKKMPETEGIVVRTRESGLIGNPLRVTKNPMVIKVKWRQ